METALTRSEVPELKLLHRGKVRDIYEVADDRLLIVATDRVSAFDHVLSPGIPGKGKILTEISCRWMKMLDVAHHLIDEPLPVDHPELEGRAVLAKKAEVVPIECVVRGYITGSGWKEYKRAGTLGFEPLPEGIEEAARLEPPRFTPTTKAKTGHDEPLSRAQLKDRIGVELATQLEDKSLALYSAGHAYAESRGLLLADTKFEWGWVDGELLLVDEVFTPDSSRFWAKADWNPGASPQPLDKQLVRNHLLGTDWDREGPPPALPEDVVQRTAAVYRELLQRLFG